MITEPVEEDVPLALHHAQLYEPAGELRCLGNFDEQSPNPLNRSVSDHRSKWLIVRRDGAVSQRDPAVKLEHRWSLRRGIASLSATLSADLPALSLCLHAVARAGLDFGARPRDRPFIGPTGLPLYRLIDQDDEA